MRYEKIGPKFPFPYHDFITVPKFSVLGSKSYVWGNLVQNIRIHLCKLRIRILLVESSTGGINNWTMLTQSVMLTLSVSPSLTI